MKMIIYYDRKDGEFSFSKDFESPVEIEVKVGRIFRSLEVEDADTGEIYHYCDADVNLFSVSSISKFVESLGISKYGLCIRNWVVCTEDGVELLLVEEENMSFSGSNKK